jgi:hydrogenase maturation protease
MSDERLREEARRRDAARAGRRGAEPGMHPSEASGAGPDPRRRVIVAVGNEYRRDDGIGPAVLDNLRDHAPAGVTLTVTDGEATELLDAWGGAELAVLIDAVICEPSVPGRIHRTEAVPEPGAAASTHGLGIPDAVRLAHALDRAPQRLVVYAVEAADLGFGHGLTSAVAAALPRVTRAVLAEVGGDIGAFGPVDERVEGG